jgi:4-oxalocrotonate tautomerase
MTDPGLQRTPVLVIQDRPIVEADALSGGRRMPLINVKVIEGTFSAQQKREMIEKLTETMVSIEGEALRPLNWVVIEEFSSGDWGIGGRPLTTENVRAMAAGAPR